MTPHAYIGVFDRQAGSADPEAQDYHPGAGGPVFPADHVTATIAPGWYSAKRPDGLMLLAGEVNDMAGRGLFAVSGPLDSLEVFAAGGDEVMPAAEAFRRWTAESAVRTWLQYWPVWCFDGADDRGDGLVSSTLAVRWMMNPGQGLPDIIATPLPWNLDADGVHLGPGTPVGRVKEVTVLHGLRFPITPAGMRMHELVANEADRG
jgi:hypothetical protein